MVNESYQKRRKMSVNALDAAETQVVTRMFSEKILVTGKKTVDFDELKELMGNSVDDNLLQLVWKLFDQDNDGAVDADEFVSTFAMLSKGMESSEAQLEAIFCMFDSDQDATLTREEFEKLVQTTVNLNLNTLLISNKGAAFFGEQLALEFSDENLAFWQAVTEYKATEDGAERVKKALALEREFVEDGAERQVNLPSSIRQPLLAALKASSVDAPPDPSVFDAASTEIFKLMERDTFARFKNNPDAIRGLVDAYYTSVVSEAGASSNSVSFDSFKQWAMSEPSVSVYSSPLLSAARLLTLLRLSSTGERTLRLPLQVDQQAAPAANRDRAQQQQCSALVLTCRWRAQRWPLRKRRRGTYRYRMRGPDPMRRPARASRSALPMLHTAHASAVSRVDESALGMLRLYCAARVPDLSPLSGLLLELHPERLAIPGGAPPLKAVLGRV